MIAISYIITRDMPITRDPEQVQICPSSVDVHNLNGSCDYIGVIIELCLASEICRYVVGRYKFNGNAKRQRHILTVRRI